MKRGKNFVGTSGWNYPHWQETFYPPEVTKDGQLAFYTQNFTSVELNNSFYRQPTLENFIKWREIVPKNFIFSVKANRFFTHMKKLNVNRVDLERFVASCAVLGEKLGPILFQLPPKWKLNIERLERFLSLLPAGYRYAFEFRDTSWYNNQVYDTLKAYNCAFCIYHLASHQSPLAVTADFTYIRLHGSGQKYQGSYDLRSLYTWLDFASKQLKENKDVYLYFDNDEKAYAAFNAMQLEGLFREKIKI